MTQAGVRLRCYSETTLPGLTEQHRIRLKEEELSGLESGVHLAESETKCTTPGLNTLVPECVTAHSGVNDVHHIDTVQIKTETDLKTESLDSTTTANVTHLHPDQIKTETDDGGYAEAEHIHVSPDVKCFVIKSDEVKFESSEILVSDLMNTVLEGTGVDQKGQTEPWQCAGEPNPVGKKTRNGGSLLHTFEQQFDAGWSLRRDTETTLPELFEQHGIRLKEEGLSGLEAVHMAESETKCTTSGLNTLEPECATAHSGVNDVHHLDTVLIKTETDLGPTNTGDLIKIENLDFVERAYVSQLHPDKIKTETDDGVYVKAEPTSVLQDIKCVDLKSEVKLEPSETLVSDLINTMRNGAQEEPFTGEPNPIGKTPGKKRYRSIQSVSCLNTPSNVSQVEGLYTGERLNHCSPCGKHFVKASTSQKRLRFHAEEKPYICTQCGKSFLRKAYLRTHQKIHTGERPHKCIECGKCFLRKSHLRTHQKIHLDEKTHQCSQCEKCFADESKLSIHKRIHTDEKPYKCDHCGKCFTHRYYLNAHERIHTGEKPYKCARCGKSFLRKSYLRTHQKIHTGERPHKCIQCGKCFLRKSHLESHQKIHLVEKPHQCSQCAKFFVDESKLSIHKIIHTAEKPYKCDQCGKCFARRCYLNVHEQIHTGKKPYMCTWCGKYFLQKAHLSTHQKIHTGEKPYKCTRCEKCFLRKSHLSSHQRIHRGKKP
ncbi:zinc finger protein 880-like isoform X2 [Conger conger]|uniref:zinc finger protein 880-like isoform X2 n=1 Tax=Conger conger TaxID=82655 RepID=UPI002A59E4C3|nr:zinc finger protein 880-like isoform X2 [Conger conger]